MSHWHFFSVFFTEDAETQDPLVEEDTVILKLNELLNEVKQVKDTVKDIQKRQGALVWKAMTILRDEFSLRHLLYSLYAVL